jgi:hypothetical protein
MIEQWGFPCPGPLPMVYDAGHEVATERPEALSNTIADFLELRETFIFSRRDGRINP